MNELIGINLNDDIYFKLTEKGKRRFTDPYFRACVHEEGDLYKTQIWIFCTLFGPGMHMGFASEVETKVYFEKNDLEGFR